MEVGDIQVEAAPEGLSTTATFITHVYYRNKRNKSSFSGVMNTCWYKKGLTGKFSSVKLIYTTTTFQRCWTFIAFDA
jgi:hypothetical protein